MKKRQVAAATYHVIPPPQSLRSASLYTSVRANGATQIQRLVVAGVVTTTSACCLSNGTSVAPGVFATVTRHSVVPISALQPLSVTATRVKT